MKKPSLLWRLYMALFLRRAWVGYLLLALLMGLAASQLTKFRLDASADSLILESDDDLHYYRKLSRRYSESEALVVTYTPDQDLFSEASLQALQRLRNELLSVAGVAGVTSILDVPLVASPRMSLSEIQRGIRTLMHPDTDRELARQEFATSPLYRSLLTDPKNETTALLVSLAADSKLSGLLQRREQLRALARTQELTSAQSLELEQVSAAYAQQSAGRQSSQQELVDRVREVLRRHDQSAQIFLGGLPMIAADMIDFVAEDIKMFGSLVLVLLILLLSLAFRQLRWVIVPLAICAATVFVVSGLIAAMNWPVTVVSSNFSSLTLIITLALVVHLVVRFRELQAADPTRSTDSIIEQTLADKLAPSVFTTLTTVVSFGSLIIADIRPVIDFGMMMVAAVLTALLLAFALFPALTRLFSAAPPSTAADVTAKITARLAGFVEAKRSAIVLTYLSVAIAAVLGIGQLGVENRFIDYFKKDTEIYQGLVLIDKKLGGTTPLDVVIRAPQSFFDEQAAFAEEFGEEFTTGGLSGSSYWFNQFALERVADIHDYLEQLPETGKVLSMASTMGLFSQLNNDQPLDNFTLSIMYNRLPDEIKQTLIAPYLSADGNEVRFSVRVIDSDQNLNRNDLLKKIEADLVANFELEPEQLRLAGALVLYNNVLQSLFSSQITTLGVVFVLIMLMLWALFRSIRIAAVGIVPTVFAALCILGLMGWLNIPLDIMTITIAAITIGIGVDNTIHYTHRYVAELQRSGDPIAAMRASHGSVGRAIYLTSVIVTIGFSILALSNFIPIVLFGLLTGLAMLVAFVANLTLLPLLLTWTYPGTQSSTP